MGVNQFTDLTEQEFIEKYIGGARIKPERAEKMKNFSFS
jgi:hypothetical protein